MIYRGCVVKVEENFAIVMTDTMECLRVVKKEGIRVGGQIIFVKEDLYKEKSSTLKPILSIAAILVIMMMSVTLSGLFSTEFIANGAAAVISVDINPSMELEINKEYKVIRIIPLNDEAKGLLDENIEGKNIQEALWIIIEQAKMKNYITKEKNSVLISTAVIKDGFQLDSLNLEEKTEKKWEEKNKETELNLLYVEGNKEDLKEARKQNVSMGKYEVFKNSMKKNKPMTIEEIKTIKVQEINDKKLLKHNKDNDQYRFEKKYENKIKGNDSKEINPQKKIKEKKIPKDSKEKYIEKNNNSNLKKVEEFKGNNSNGNKDRLKEKDKDKDEKLNNNSKNDKSNRKITDNEKFNSGKNHKNNKENIDDERVNNSNKAKIDNENSNNVKDNNKNNKKNKENGKNK